MKLSHTHLIFKFFLLTLSFSPMAGFTQKITAPTSCSDSLLSHQADSLQNLLQSAGFELVKSAFVEMESQYEQPVILPLTAGSWYEMIFIGDAGSRLLELRLYDWSEKEVVYQKKTGSEGGANLIRFSFIPRFSEYHMLKPLQINRKKRTLCGCLLLFRRVA